MPHVLWIVSWASLIQQISIIYFVHCLLLSTLTLNRWWLAPRPGRLQPRKIPGTHCIRGWVGPSVGLGGSGKFCPSLTGIRSPDLAASIPIEPTKTNSHAVTHPSTFHGHHCLTRTGVSNVVWPLALYEVDWCVYFSLYFVSNNPILYTYGKQRLRM